MPNLSDLATAATAKGDPRRVHNRRATLAAGLRRITEAYEAEFYTVVPMAHVRALIAELDPPAEGGK